MDKSKIEDEQFQLLKLDLSKGMPSSVRQTTIALTDFRHIIAEAYLALRGPPAHKVDFCRWSHIAIRFKPGIPDTLMLQCVVRLNAQDYEVGPDGLHMFWYD